MAGKVGSAANLVERAFACDSIEVGNYLKAVEIMESHQFGFEDVEMFFLQPTLDVFLNLIGLHYCITWLGIPVTFFTHRFVLFYFCYKLTDA